MRYPRFKVQGLAILLAGVGLLSCASFAGRAAGRAAPTAVQGSLDTLNSPEGRAAIRELMTSPEVQEGVRQLAASLIDGTSSAVASEERAAQLQQLTELLSRGIASGIIAGADEPANRAKLNRLASELSHTMARGFIDELTHSMTPEDRDEFIQGLRNALFESSRELSKGVVAGFSDALAKDREERGVGPEDTLTAQMSALLKRGSRITMVIAIGVLLAIPAIVLLLFALHVRHRRERERWEQTLAELRSRSSETVHREDMVKALKEILSDPAARQTISQELRPAPSPPTTH